MFEEQLLTEIYVTVSSKSLSGRYPGSNIYEKFIKMHMKYLECCWQFQNWNRFYLQFDWNFCHLIKKYLFNLLWKNSQARKFLLRQVENVFNGENISAQKRRENYDAVGVKNVFLIIKDYNLFKSTHKH